MKIFKIFIFCVLIILTSCQTSSYSIVSPQRLGVDFTKGRWVLNVIDCPEPSKNQLTLNATKFFKKNLKDRFFYIKDVDGLLIMPKTKLNPNKIKLKELKDGTEFDFFINIVVKKNRDDLGNIGLYEDQYPSGKNEAEAVLEIYDLNLQQIIYSQHVVGSSASKSNTFALTSQKAEKLQNNITLHENTGSLMVGSLNKILKHLEKTSVKN